MVVVFFGNWGMGWLLVGIAVVDGVCIVLVVGISVGVGGFDVGPCGDWVGGCVDSSDDTWIKGWVGCTCLVGVGNGGCVVGFVGGCEGGLVENREVDLVEGCGGALVEGCEVGSVEGGGDALVEGFEGGLVDGGSGGGWIGVIGDWGDLVVESSKWTDLVLVDNTFGDWEGVAAGFSCLLAGNVFEESLGCTGVFEDMLEGTRGTAGSVVDEDFFKDDLEDIVGLEGAGIFEEEIWGARGFGSRWDSEGDGWSYLELREQ
jgi:hypothetical protein